MLRQNIIQVSHSIRVTGRCIRTKLRIKDAQLHGTSEDPRRLQTISFINIDTELVGVNLLHQLEIIFFRRTQRGVFLSV